MKVGLVDFMGDDLAVVNAARVSFDKESEWEWVESGVKAFGIESYQTLSDADTKLIHYLAKHNHWSPFAHTAITLRVSAPVPIRTQCMKHAVGMNINEESRRYISSRPEVFYPKEWRMSAGNVKQGSGGVHPKSAEWVASYENLTSQAVNTYMGMIENNICPEQARLILPQGCIVNWIWTGNLASYARFYNQRSDPHAQKEVRDLAGMVADIIVPLYPVSWLALTGEPK